jgi:hypothetical protein
MHCSQSWVVPQDVVGNFGEPLAESLIAGINQKWRDDKLRPPTAWHLK